MLRTCRLPWLALAFAVLVVPPALADDYLVYHEVGLPPDTSLWIWCGEDPSEQGLCPFFSERINQCNNPEGSRHLRVPSDSWAGFGIFYTDDQAPPQNTLREDLSAFAGGEIRFFARSPLHDFEAGFQCDEGAGIVGYTLLDVLTTYGSGPGPGWQEIAIPVADFYTGADLTSCLQNVSSSFLSTGAGNPTLYQIDNIRWRKPESLDGASSVTVSGRQLLVNGKPFVVNGVAYSPQSIGENFAGGFRDRPDLYADDFSAIAAMGANTVRTYSTFLTKAMLDTAWANGLYVIPTFPVDPVQFGCDAGRAFMQDRLEEAIQQWKDHPAILLWMIGNEIEVQAAPEAPCETGTCTVSAAACASEGDCTSGFCSFDTGTTCDPSAIPTTCPQTPVAQTCIPETCSKGWYSVLEQLAAAADVADPSHPTGTSNADLGNIGIADCSDDGALGSLDVWGANLYRGCTFSTAFSTYQTLSGKPLLITEFGSDAWNTGAGMEDQAMQANCVASLLGEAEGALAVRSTGGVSTGQILFSWMDEWWKAVDVPPYVCEDGTANACTPCAANADCPGGSSVPPTEECIAGACSPAGGPATCTAGARCIATCNTYWDKHDTCVGWTQFGYPDPSIQEEFWGVAKRETFCSDLTTPCVTDEDCFGAPGTPPGTCSVTTSETCRFDGDCPGTCSPGDPIACTEDDDCPGLCSGTPPSTCNSNADCPGIQTCIFGTIRCVHEPCNETTCSEVREEDVSVRVPRSAYNTVAGTYQLGAVVNLKVDTFDNGTGDTGISFDPATGAADHTLYYGPLSAMSTYGYSGSVGGLGATGTGSVTLPLPDSLFYLVVAENGLEGCYGKDSSCNERPGSGAPQAANRTCDVPQCP